MFEPAGCTDRRATRRTHPYVEEAGGSIQPAGSGISASAAGIFACFGSAHLFVRACQEISWTVRAQIWVRFGRRRSRKTAIIAGLF